MVESPSNEDYWFNDEIPEQWYKKEYSGNQVPAEEEGAPKKCGFVF
jgi:hypothetical protein